jgi:hypothetical protein
MAATTRTVLSEAHRRAIGEGQRRRHERQRNDPAVAARRLHQRRMRLLYKAWVLEQEAESLRQQPQDTEVERERLELSGTSEAGGRVADAAA